MQKNDSMRIRNYVFIYFRVFEKDLKQLFTPMV